MIPGLNTSRWPSSRMKAFDIVRARVSHDSDLYYLHDRHHATVWHLANGIWLFLVDWGITIGERAQRLTGYACIAFGVLLLLVGINAAVAFIRPGGLLGGM
jgi:succinate dehydrogenase / fumarate reductase cytochrome b subunit